MQNNYDYWINLLNSQLTDRDFQYLSRQILQRTGFQSVEVRAKGPDGGRDIECLKIKKLENGEVITEHCWVSCKKQKDQISWPQISQDVTRAANDKIELFMIMSNNDTSNPCKDEIKKWNSQNRCRVIDWCGTKFIESLQLAPDVLKTWFPDEKLPPMFNQTVPAEMINASKKQGAKLGLTLDFQITKKLDLSNIKEVSEFIKEEILKRTDLEVNLRALLYEKISLLFTSIGEIDDAIMFLDKSLEITPNNESALLSKAYNLSIKFKLKLANGVYDKILKLNPKNIFALNGKAYNLMMLGEYETAIKTIEEELAIDAKFIAGIKTKAEILKAMGNEKEALAFLEQHDKFVSDSIPLKLTKVDVLTRLLDLKEAFRLNEEILRVSPNYIKALNQKGVIYERNSRYQKRTEYLELALEQFEEVLKVDKKFSIAWTNKAIMLFSLGDIQQAKTVLNEVSKLLPEFPHYWNKLGVCYMKERKFKKALKCYNKALKMMHDEEFLINKLEILLQMGRYDEIIAESNIESTNEDLWLIRAGALTQKHELYKANLCRKKAEKYHKEPISLIE